MAAHAVLEVPKMMRAVQYSSYGGDAEGLEVILDADLGLFQIKEFCPLLSISALLFPTTSSRMGTFKHILIMTLSMSCCNGAACRVASSQTG